jgi:TonB-dependent SusC/RagA subfamily outer membrane receptor
MSQRSAVIYFVALLGGCGRMSSSPAPSVAPMPASTAVVEQLERATIRSVPRGADSGVGRTSFSPIAEITARRSATSADSTGVRIRCVNTVTDGHEPVYVVDGVVVGLQSDSTIEHSVAERHLSELDPNEIESIEVLKAPQAVALYGPGGHYGVVIIMTKRKQRQRP